MKRYFWSMLFFSLVSCQTGNHTGESRQVAQSKAEVQALAIDKSKFLPPKILYHYGLYDHLIKNANAHQISQADWDNYIMTGGRYGLVNYRSGFYGCSMPSQCESYGVTTSGKSPWLNIVTLKDECRQSVILPNYLYQDANFSDWYAQKKSLELSYQDFITRCQNNFSLDLTRGNEGVCEKIIAQYMTETHAAVVLDEGMPDVENPKEAYNSYNSWYIRDRSCIQNIGGNPNEVIQLIATKKYWQVDGEFISNRSVAIIDLFISALSRTDANLDLRLLEKIKTLSIEYSAKQEEDIDDKNYRTSFFISKLIESFRNCPSKSALKKKMEAFVAAHQQANFATLKEDVAELKYFNCK